MVGANTDRAPVTPVSLVVPAFSIAEDTPSSPTVFENQPPIELLAPELQRTMQHSWLMIHTMGIMGIHETYEDGLHDVEGIGSKLDPEVLMGLAWDGHKPQYLEQSLAHHRGGQNHHRVHTDKNLPQYEHHVMVNAVDASVCKLQHRPYQGGPYSFDNIREQLKRNPFPGIPHLLVDIAIEVEKALKYSRFSEMYGIGPFPQVPIPLDKYHRMAECRTQVLDKLEALGYNRQKLMQVR